LQLLYDFKIGYCPEIAELDPELTAKDTLELVGGLREMAALELETEIKRLIDTFSMEEWFSSMLTKNYSMGMKRKLALSVALLGSVRYSILDEPFNGLDPECAFKFKKLLKDKRNSGCGIIISSHLLDSVEKLCDHILILYQSELIYNGTLDNLKMNFNLCHDLESIYFTIMQKRGAYQGM
jgi:ABC-2 type transport system ATP-binding protein